jgi:hypothetical protein
MIHSHHIASHHITSDHIEIVVGVGITVAVAIAIDVDVGADTAAVAKDLLDASYSEIILEDKNRSYARSRSDDDQSAA